MANGTTAVSAACQKLLDRYNEASYEKIYFIEPKIQEAKDERLASGAGVASGGVTALVGLGAFPPFGLALTFVGVVGAGLSYRNYRKAKKDLADARRRCAELRRQMAEAWTAMVQGGCPSSVIPPRSEFTQPCG